MKVVRPLPTSLTASSVPETDYPAWAPGTSYGLGARVIVATLHRVFESVVAGNVGHDPATAGASYWIDAGPTNRWAMFDPAAGPATSATAPIVVTLALADAADAIGLVDLQAASVRVQIVAAGVTIFDETRNGPAACEVFLGLPVAAARAATITIAPTGAAAIIGKLVTGKAIDLGTLADAPTIGITDFSRRETDAFGITTVAQRGWTKRIEAKCLIAAAAVDGIQRQLAAIRAQAALWIGEGDYSSLISYGFFKDFSQIVSLQGISTCSLSIDSLPAADIAVPAADPALVGASDFQVVRPIAVTDSVLISSSVAENDYPTYSPDRTYIAGERVLVPSAHRVYESTAGGNKGNTPGADTTHWVDAGPSKRWAMFDQALGTATTAAGAITVQLRPASAIDAVALLDVVAASVRVQAPGYDRTQLLAQDSTTALFLDLSAPAGADVIVTVTANAGAAAVGTLLLGAREGLGLLADAPTSTILDFSTKQTDDFGQTVPVERAWAKKMEAQSQIATARADALLRRLATLRAVPALWIGATDFEALTIYGFFRDFTITLGAQVSTTSVTIEGLAKASPDAPSNDVVKWENIVGPGKPADNATVGAPAGTNVGGVPAEQIADAVKDASGAVVPAREQFAAVKAQIDAAVGAAQTDAAHARDDAAAARSDLSIEVQRAKDAEGAISTTLASVKTTADQAKAGVTDEATVRAAGDIALGNRLSTTEAQLAGSQNSQLQARIAAEETARANQDNAIASKVSTVEATAARATYLNRNAHFSETWSTNGYPPGWDLWAGDGAPYIGWWNATTGNGRYGPYALQVDRQGKNCGVAQWINGQFPAGWYVLEMEGRFEDGDTAGSGMLAQFLRPDLTEHSAGRLSFVVEPDSSGFIGGRPNRAFSKLVWANEESTAIKLHLMSGWEGYANPSRGFLRTIWFKAGIRPATRAEIDAKAVTDANVIARITTEETTRASQDTALANRLATTEAQLSGSQDSALRARISSEETARASQDSALANRISTTEAQLAGSQNSQLQARIAAEETARADQDAAIASRTSTVEASIGVDAASLNANPTFKVWGNPLAPPDNWFWWDSGTGIVRAGGVNGRPFSAQFNAPANQNGGIMQLMNAAFGAWVIEFTGRASDWQGAGVLAQFCSADGNTYYEEAQVSAAVTPDTSGYTSRDGGGGAYTRTFSRFYQTQINGGIRLIKLYAMANWDVFGERAAKTVVFDRVSIRPATAAEIAGQRADGNASNAQARVAVTESAIAILNGRAAAYWQVVAVAGNNRAQLTVRADANSGAGIDFGGDVTFKGNIDVGSDSGPNRVKLTNNGITFYDANGTYRGGMGLKP